MAPNTSRRERPFENLARLRAKAVSHVFGVFSDGVSFASRNASSTSSTRGNYLKKSFVKKNVCELVWCLWFCSKKCMGARSACLPRKKPLTIYKLHQIVITELEIGAVGTDCSRRTSWRAREDPERARTWKSMKNMHVSEMYTHAKSDQNTNHMFLD
jgi:hypothetical protein